MTGCVIFIPCKTILCNIRANKYDNPVNYKAEILTYDLTNTEYQVRSLTGIINFLITQSAPLDCR